MCHHVFIYDRRDNNNNPQTNGSNNKYLSNTRGGVMQMKSIATR